MSFTSHHLVRRTSAAILAVCLAMTMLVPDASAHSQRPSIAFGYAQVESTAANIGADPIFNFFAVDRGDGDAFGRVSYRTTRDDPSRFRGSVDCYNELDEDTVAISGPITATNVPSWMSYIAWVHDEPGRANDWIRVTIGPGLDCNTHPFSSTGVPATEQWGVIRGFLRVR